MQMPDDDHRSAATRATLADEFERHRPYLRAVAYRMLGSVTEAEDALQECWLRLDRRPPADTADLRPWLTTVISRICLDMLRSRRSRHEDYAGSWLPEPIVDRPDDASPEDAVVLADSVGLALLVVLETLTPAERLAFVLHDVFALPFDEIATVVDRSPAAARQLASRAQAADPGGQAGAGRRPRGPAAGRRRLRGSRPGRRLRRPALAPRSRCGPAHRRWRARTAGSPAGRRCHGGHRGVPGRRDDVRTARPPRAGQRRAGVVVGPPGRVVAVVGFSVVGGLIREIDIIGDRAKLQGLQGG